MNTIPRGSYRRAASIALVDPHRTDSLGCENTSARGVPGRLMASFVAAGPDISLLTASFSRLLDRQFSRR